MTSLQSRVVTFVVGVPGISALILLLPQANHVAFNALATLLIIQGSRETANIFRQKGYSIPPGLPFLSALFPVSAWLLDVVPLPQITIEVLTILLIMVVLAREINVPEETDVSTALPRIGGSLLTLLYPGLFAVYAVRITALPDAGVRLFSFLILVFANDTAAYIFGSLFGRSSRKLFRASPNKSLVGFTAGFLFCVLVSLIIQGLLPQVFGSFATALLAGGAVGITGIIGDLAESALKRSAVIKDSGDLVPGRGGILDSIDSIVFSAPLYYLILAYCC